MTPDTIRLKYLGKTPRTFALPIPFASEVDRSGEVTCDPIGEFPADDAERLLELAPEAFERLDAAPPEPSAPTTTEPPEVVKLPPLEAPEPKPGVTLADRLRPRLRRRLFPNKGVAVLQRNKYLPDAEVVKRADGQWELVDPAPGAAPDKEQDAI